MKRLLSVCALLCFVAGCEKPNPNRVPAIAALTGSAVAGKAVYAAACAACHQPDGKGDSHPTLDGGMLYPSLVERAKALSAAEFLGSTINGRPGTAMLGYSSLGDQQLADVYAYVKSL